MRLLRLDTRGYTLVELLVVLAIVGLVSAVLLPGLVRARSLVLGAGCQNHLRQWGLATHLFAGDNDGYLPKDGAPNGTWTDEGWYIDLPRVLGIPTYPELTWRTNAAIAPGPTPWLCPANRRRSNGNNLFHYCLNRYVNGTGTESVRRRLSEIAASGQTVWMFDNGRAAAVAGENNVHTNLHKGGAHFLFIDGHVERLPNRRYWDFSRNRGRLDSPEVVWKPGM